MLDDKIIIREKKEVTTWVKWKNNVEFCIAYIPTAVLQKKMSKQLKFKPTQDGKSFDVDFKDQIPYAELLKNALIDWKGLTLFELQFIVEPHKVQIDIKNDADAKTKIPFEKKYKDIILNNCTFAFGDFVYNIAASIHNFIYSQQEELKNSKRSVSG